MSQRPQALERLAKVALEYRRAFDRVQGMMSTHEHGELPRWAFAVDRVPLEEIEALDGALAGAEQLRRRWRTALHATAELLALEDDGAWTPWDDSVTEDLATPSLEEGDRERLDRFLSVLHHAREGGCIYVNGAFEPVDQSVPESLESDPGAVRSSSSQSAR